MTNRAAAQTRRLWALVDLMKYDPDPENFTMLRYNQPCGAPACLLGHAWENWPLSKTGAGQFFGLDWEESKYLFSDGLQDQSRKFDTQSIAASRVIDVIYGV